jgi:hypothetical protein
MTPLSWFRAKLQRVIGANPLQRKGANAMARPLLTLCVMGWMMTGGAAATSCVIPPNLELDEVDGGVGAAPRIDSVGAQLDTNFSLPGPLVLDRGSEERLILTIFDNDISDEHYVRIFVNYPQDPAVRASCQSGPSGELLRIIDCPARSLCDGVDDQDTSRQFVEAIVSDRPFLADNHPDAQSQPQNRALPTDAGFGFRAWLLICNPAD